MYLFF